MAEAKGATLLATLEFVRMKAGADAVARALDALPAAQRSAVEGTRSTDTIDLRLLFALWHAVDGVLAPELPDWAERAGAYSIESVGVQLYGGILRKGSPREFLNQPVKLFRLFYHTGDMRVVEQDDARAVLRLLDLDVTDPLFCRRQTGGLRRALELAGAERAGVRHVRCTFEGDAFCEWELEWLRLTPAESSA
jgi:hypothetical protein